MDTTSHRNRRIVLSYFLFSLGFGILMGFVFPLYAGFFVEYKSGLHRVIFTSGCIGAGIAVGLASFLIGRATVLRVIKTVSSRIGELCETDGDLSRDIALVSSDCIGALVGNFNRFQEKLRVMVGHLAEAADKTRLAGEAMEVHSLRSSADIEALAETLGRVARIAELQRDQIGLSGETVKTVLEQITQADALTQGMAGQFFVFSQAMEATRRGIQATSEQARQTEVLSRDIQKTGERGQEVLETLRRSFGGVAERTERIEEVVRFILDVADRTNLLSMNAAIEAARAGHGGRGFSVVADEIRRLAETSSTQGKVIQDLLREIDAAVSETRGVSDTVHESFRALQTGIDAVRASSQIIADQMGTLEDQDTKLTSGLSEFLEFYGQLSESMAQQIEESRSVEGALDRLEEASRQIGGAVREQQVGMDRTTETMVQVRGTATALQVVIATLQGQIGQFRLPSPPLPRA